MPLKAWISLSIIIICFMIALCNRKILCKQLLIDFFNIFKNFRTGKISIIDILSFFVSPLLIFISIVFGFNYIYSIQMANILLTVFSIIFTLLFGIMSMLSVTLNSDDKIKKQISKEAFSAVSFSMLSSLFCLVLLIIYIAFIETTNYIMLFKILTMIISFLIFNMIMLFLMIIKRSYVTSLMEKNRR